MRVATAPSSVTVNVPAVSVTVLASPYTVTVPPIWVNVVIVAAPAPTTSVLSLLMLAFPASESQKSGVVAGSDGYLLSSQAEETGKRVAAGVPAAPPAAVAAMRERSDAGQLLQMIHTRVGPGPQVVATEEKWWQEV